MGEITRRGFLGSIAAVTIACNLPRLPKFLRRNTIVVAVNPAHARHADLLADPANPAKALREALREAYQLLPDGGTIRLLPGVYSMRNQAVVLPGTLVLSAGAMVTGGTFSMEAGSDDYAIRIESGGDLRYTVLTGGQR